MNIRIKHILIFCFVKCILLAQNNEMDSLLNALKVAKEDTNKVLILYQLSEVCEEQDILKYAEEAVILSEKLKYNRGIANALNNIGFYYSNFSKNKFKALDYYQRSLKLQLTFGDYRKIAECYANIGYLFQSINDFDKDMEYAKKSNYYALLSKDSLLISSTYNNIAMAFEKRQNLDSSFFYLMKAYEINKRVNEKAGSSTNLTNLGMYFYKKGDRNKALNYLEKSLNLNKEINDVRGMAYVCHNISLVYLSLKNYKKAFEFEEQSYQLASKFNIPDKIATSTLGLSNLFLLNNDYKNAYKFLLIHKKISDSIVVLSMRDKSIESQLKLDFEIERNNLKTEQEKKDMLKREEEKKQRIARNFLLAGIFLIAIFTLFIYRGYIRKQKDNMLITSQKNQIEEKQKEILDSIRYAKRIQTSLMPNEKYILKKIDSLK